MFARVLACLFAQVAVQRFDATRKSRPVVVAERLDTKGELGRTYRFPITCL